MTPELITAISGALLGLGGFAVSMATRRDAAKQSEIDGLRKIIETQRGEIDRLLSRVAHLEAENGELRARLAGKHKGSEW